MRKCLLHIIIVVSVLTVIDEVIFSKTLRYYRRYRKKRRRGIFKLNGIAIRGNIGISSDEIMSVIGLKEGKTYSSKTIKRKIDILKRYFKRRGFTRARIEAFIDLDLILNIIIKEAYINETIVLGKNLYMIYTIKQNLTIKEGELYNELKIKRAMKILKKRFRLKRAGYYIKPLIDSPHLINIYIWTRGFKKKGSSISYSADASVISIKPIIRYSNYRAFNIEHKFELEGFVNFVPYNVSYWGVKAKYHPPPFIRFVRPYLESRYYWEMRSQKNLNIKYKYSVISMGLFSSYRLFKYITLAEGVFHHFVDIEGFDPIDSSISPTLPPENEYKNPNMFELNSKIIYENSEGRYRRDKKFRLGVSYSMFWKVERGKFYSLSIWGQKVFELGYNDIVLRTKNNILWGNVPFFRQITPYEYMCRGYDKNNYYSLRINQLSVDYKMSILRDNIKLIFFVDHTFVRRDDSYDYYPSYGEGIELKYKELIFQVFYGMPVEKPITEGRVLLRAYKAF